MKRCLGFVLRMEKNMVFIKNSALQEYAPVQPEDLLTRISELPPEVSLAIIPFRVQAVAPYPVGEDYIMALIRARYKVELLVKLTDFRFNNPALNSIAKIFHLFTPIICGCL